jgi:2-C-methyl-D-erythritol 4-phosphate cytidylyltransferase
LNVSALLVAAGFGSRLGAQLPKALVVLQGVPLAVRSARALASSAHVTSLIVVVPAGYEARVREQLDQAGGWPFPLQLVAGGAERQDSVRAGLAAVADADLILIHDAARPFVRPETVDAAISTAQQYGAAVVGIPASDTIKDVDEDGWITATPPRTRMWQVQTPQVFRADLIRTAHQRALADQVVATDDSALVERLGVRVRMVRGTPENRKITTPDDLRWAEWYLSTQPALR